MHVRGGFRTVVRQPALVLGEIIWRWAFGAAGWTLVIIATHRALAGVDITQAEVLIARHSDVFLIADACARILYQVLPQLARECAVLVPAIAVLWIVAATVGRAITLEALLSVQRVTSPINRTFFADVLVLHLLRAFFTLASMLAFCGALLLAGMMMAQNITAAAIVSMFFAALVVFFWSAVNWFLALAPVWIVRDGEPTMKSIAASVDLLRRSPGAYAAITTWFGVFRALAWVTAFIAALFAAQASPAAAIALCVVIALVYFAVADFLYIARLAAFAALDESSQPSAISIQPTVPEPLMPASVPRANSG